MDADLAVRFIEELNTKLEFNRHQCFQTIFR